MKALPDITFWFRNPKQIISDSWSERNVILESDVNLFSWKRKTNQQISSYLQHVVSSDKEPISFFTDVNDLEKWISEIRGIWDGENKTAGDAFWKDVFIVVRDFLTFSPSQSGTVILKVIHSNQCTKFHTDGYPLRLFTTYYGKGTEWLPEKALNRGALGKRNDQIVKNPFKIQRMETFEVGILKGELSDRMNPTPGIVHRSPEIEKTGEKRIILRVDI
ncbi:DUF1826 domain-containing protein [Ekhidna sp.]